MMVLAFLSCVFKPCPPLLRVLRRMEYGIDDNTIFSEFVENLEWKAPNQSASKVVEYDRIETRMALDTKNARIYTAKKVFAQSWLLTFIPTVMRNNIVLSVLGINNALNHSEFAHAV